MEGLASLFKRPSPKLVADKHLSPAQTIQWVEGVLSQKGRIFQELRRVDKGRLGIPVYMSLYGSDGLALTGNVKQMGKGTTEELAQASALMELVERYCLFKKIRSRPFIRASWEELGPKALSLETWVQSVEEPAQDQTRGLIQEILPRIPLHWECAYEAFTETERFIPIFWFWLLYEYNGSSAGNTWAEAAVQGLCEVIERHVCAIASRNRLVLPGLEVKGEDAEVNALLNCFKRLGVKLYLRDMTLGMPIPTIAVLAYDPSTFPHRSEIVYTAGTATSPQRALVRALTEVAQLAGDFDTEGHYLESGLPKYTTLEEARHVLDQKGTCELGDLPDLSRPDHVEELHELASRLASKDFLVYVSDFTDPCLNIPVVYTSIPGAHFRSRICISLLYQLVRTVALYAEPQEALDILLFLRDKAPKRYYLESYLGQILVQLHRPHEARSYFESALVLDPPKEDRIGIWCHLAHLYLAEGSYKKARQTAEKALSHGELPELYNILGTACFKLNDISSALEAYLKALELNPQSAQDHANVGACLARLGLKAKAQEFFNVAQELDPNLDLYPYRRLLRV